MYNFKRFVLTLFPVVGAVRKIKCFMGELATTFRAQANYVAISAFIFNFMLPSSQFNVCTYYSSTRNAVTP
jgi:hypothetical protein